MRYVLNLADTPAVVLLYHRVTHLPADPQLLSVEPGHFYDQIAWLRAKYTLLSIEEFTDMVTQGKKMPKRSVILTFDDGYADNYLEALPILESLQSQALFYISTSRLNTPFELWWDDLERIFLLPDVLPLTLRLDVKDRQYSWPTGTKEEREHVYHTIHPLLKFLPPVERDGTIDYLLQWAGLKREGRPTHRMLTFDELINMDASASAVIGAHTHNHPALSALFRTEQTREITQSRDILEDLTNKKITHFSYPFGGKRDYNEDSIRICREAGFRMVCSNFYGQVHRWTSAWQVPRILVRNWNKTEFAHRLSKFFIS